ncbi:hypothetical protein CBN_1093 [Clostridium botulinum NCTC 2916]|uniref:Uncharacterized protein n=1 Tax=Clostridium botulinum (strain Langeland / NCTC 10281 / Type F) TaxID=441772 RepID=A7GC59_CLOBL|nr:hypothetical protein CLI_1103 [Clostridium botulinum F str. Langeland]ADF98834.1 hypothetical protein CBF_1074 [Clostridium botulinum F str. 230613]EDT82560.1 hypothetical protein CBN_1093 [Clostridium botulinum NCTC 2916]
MSLHLKILVIELSKIIDYNFLVQFYIAQYGLPVSLTSC